MAENAEEDIVLILGKFGILPIFRGTAIQSINDAAERGVRKSGFSPAGWRTIRFYGDIHGSIQLRYFDDLDAQGVVKDTSEVIQYLSSDENPVGKGKNDAALVIESSQFAESQRNLIEAIWKRELYLLRPPQRGIQKRR